LPWRIELPANEPRSLLERAGSLSTHHRSDNMASMALMEYRCAFSGLVALTPSSDLFVHAKDLFIAAMVDRRQETVVEGQTERGPGQRGMMARASVSRVD
jgi:hypothetical protein